MPRLILIVSLLFAGCGSDPIRYHIIDTVTLPQDSSFAHKERLYALRDTTLPEYLQGQYLVHRDANGALIIDKTRLWGETFPENLRRVLGEMIAQRSGSNHIYVFPLKSHLRPERFIDIQFSEMMADYRENAVIVRGKWQISEAQARKPLSSHDFTRRYPLPDTDSNAIVAAYRQALIDLSAAILPTL